MGAVSWTDGSVVVAGAGAAGIACALGLARAGAEVILIEPRERVGGTVVHALIHTLGGLLDGASQPLNPGLPVELEERLVAADPDTRRRRIGRTWTLGVQPQVYAAVVAGWLTEYPQIRVWCRSRVTALSLDAVGGLTGLVAQGPAGRRDLEPAAVVDATGSAEVVRLADPRLVEPGAAVSGLVARLSGVAPDALRFPRGVALLRKLRQSVIDGALPPACAGVWLDQGVRSDEAYLKLAVPAGDYDPAVMAAAVAALTALLGREDGFERAGLAAVGELGIRDGGAATGEYRLSADDVRAGRGFDDGLCRADWPIEYWHPEQGVQLEYLEAGRAYQIPRRALKVAGVGRLWVAGKCLSADPLARASARVVGTCWAMGAGLAQVLTTAEATP